MTAKTERFGCPKCLSVFRSGFPRCPLDGAVLQTVSDDPLIGIVLAERYVIESLIGEGGMGRVYRARHIRMSRRFAIKVLFGDLAADAKARSRFSREAEASSRLSHPNVISVVNFGETDEGLLYLAMDYIEGDELHRVVGKQAPFTTVRALNILRQLARGLSHAHERGLVHRDFKTENILVTVNGEDEIVRIVNFGIAVIGEMTQPEQRLTTDGMVLGTPAYMSPEQSTGEDVDHRTDLFSLGVMLYEMLSGKLPFDGSPIAMAKANLAARVPPIAERVPGLRADRRLEAVAMRLMAKDPEQRFPSAAALLAHLDSVFGRAADTLPPPVAAVESPPESAPVRTMSEESFLKEDEVAALPAQPILESVEMEQTQRRRWVIAGGVVLVTVLVTGGALFAHYRNRSQEKETAAASAADGDTAVQPDLTAPVPAAAPDAGAAAALPSAPADAAPVQVAAREPAAAAGHKPSRDRHKKEPAAAAARSVPPAAPVVSRDDFDRRYHQVGALLEKLSNQRGAATADALGKKYLDIPYNDALRSESVRNDADRVLRALASRIDAELKK